MQQQYFEPLASRGVVWEEGSASKKKKKTPKYWILFFFLLFFLCYSGDRDSRLRKCRSPPDVYNRWFFLTRIEYFAVRKIAFRRSENRFSPLGGKKKNHITFYCLILSYQARHFYYLFYTIILYIEMSLFFKINLCFFFFLFIFFKGNWLQNSVSHFLSCLSGEEGAARGTENLSLCIFLYFFKIFIYIFIFIFF